MSKEAKPIALLYIKEDVFIDHNERLRFQDQISQEWSDYHCLVIPAKEYEQERVMELQVFYDKDFTDLHYEELKKWIELHLQPSQPTENKP